MEDWLSNPQALFDIRGRVAIVTGASGAFGVLAAGNAAELATVAGDCAELGAAVETMNLRPEAEEDCASITGAAVARFGAVDILVVASGMNDVAPATEMSP